MMERRTPKTTITQGEYLQLIGLLTIATMHNKTLKDIEKCAYAITGETDECGHTSDAIFSDYGIEHILDRLDLKVEPTPTVDAVGMSVG